MTPHDPLEELRRQVARHEKDLYHGNGKPGVTTRLQVVEDGLDRIGKNLGKMTWLLVAIFLSIVANFILKVAHL